MVHTTHYLKGNVMAKYLRRIKCGTTTVSGRSTQHKVYVARPRREAGHWSITDDKGDRMCVSTQAGYWEECSEPKYYKRIGESIGTSIRKGVVYQSPYGDGLLLDDNKKLFASDTGKLSKWMECGVNGRKLLFAPPAPAPEEGDVCPMEDCTGRLENVTEDTCSCAVSSMPPCGVCSDPPVLECDTCGHVCEEEGPDVEEGPPTSALPAGSTIAGVAKRVGGDDECNLSVGLLYTVYRRDDGALYVFNDKGYLYIVTHTITLTYYWDYKPDAPAPKAPPTSAPAVVGTAKRVAGGVRTLSVGAIYTVYSDDDGSLCVINDKGNKYIVTVINNPKFWEYKPDVAPAALPALAVTVGTATRMASGSECSLSKGRVYNVYSRDDGTTLYVLNDKGQKQIVTDAIKQLPYWDYSPDVGALVMVGTATYTSTCVGDAFNLSVGMPYAVFTRDDGATLYVLNDKGGRHMVTHAVNNRNFWDYKPTAPLPAAPAPTPAPTALAAAAKALKTLAAAPAGTKVGTAIRGARGGECNLSVGAVYNVYSVYMVGHHDGTALYVVNDKGDRYYATREIHDPILWDYKPDVAPVIVGIATCVRAEVGGINLSMGMTYPVYRRDAEKGATLHTLYVLDDKGHEHYITHGIKKAYLWDYKPLPSKTETPHTTPSNLCNIDELTASKQTKPTKPKGSIAMKIETATLINGDNAKNIDSDGLLRLIRKEKEALKALEDIGLGDASKTVTKMQEKHTSNIVKLIVLLDEREEV